MTTDDLLVDPGEMFDPILVRLIDDEPMFPVFVEIEHTSEGTCVMLEAAKVPELIRALERVTQEGVRE